MNWPASPLAYFVATDTGPILCRSRIPGLEPRQVEILALTAGGYSTAEIARDLGLAVRTVENHLTDVYERIGVMDRTQLVIEAIRREWVAFGEVRAA